MSATEIGVAYLSIVPSIQGLQGKMAEQLAPAESEAKSAGLKAGEGFSTGFSSTIAGAGRSVTALGDKAQVIGTSFSSASATAVTALDRLQAASTAAGATASEAMKRYAVAAEQAAGGNASAIASLDRFGAEATLQTARAEAAVKAYAVAATTAGDEAAAGLSKGTASGISSVTSQLDKASGMVKGLAGGLLAGFAISGGLAFFKDAAKAANDDAVAVRMVKGEYGSAADTVLKFSENAANAYGMSASAANMAAAQMGQFLGAMGITGETAANLSTKVIGLSADIGKFVNADPASVESAIEGALKGRGAAMAQFGVHISTATVLQEALTEGLIKQGQTMTDAQRATATLGLIMKQTANEQGAFAKSSGEIATSQTILKANLENMAATAGNAVMPVLSALSSMAVNVLVPAVKAIFAVLQPVLNVFSSLPKPVTEAAAGLGILLLLKGPLGSMFSAVSLGIRNFVADVGSIKAAAAESGSKISSLGAAAQRSSSGFASLGKAIGAGGIFAVGTVILDSFTKQAAAAKAVEDQLTSSISATGDVLLAQNGQWDGASKAAAVASVAGSDLFKQLTDHGAKYGDVMDLVVGNTKNASKVLSELNLKGASADTAASLWKYAIGLTTIKDKATAATAATMAWNAEQARTATAASIATGVMVSLSDTYRNTSDQANHYIGDLTRLGKGQDDAKSGALALVASFQAIDKQPLATQLQLYGDWLYTVAGKAGLTATQAASARDRISELGGVMLTAARASDLSVMSKSIKGVTDAATTASAAVQGLAINIDILTGRDVPLEDANKNLNVQILAMGTAFKDAATATKNHTDALITNEGHITTTTAAGQKLYDSVTAYKDAYDVAVIAAENAAGAHATVAQKEKAAQQAADGARQAFINQAMTIKGMTLPAAEALAHHFGILSGIKFTPKVLSLSAQDKASAAIDALNRKVQGLQDKAIVLTVTDQATGAFTTAAGSKGFAGGGLITGAGTGTSDSINARLSDGEFVVRAAAVKPNRALLEHINNGFADGGMVNVKMLAQGNAIAGISSFLNGSVNAASSAAAAQAKQNAAISAASIPAANNSGVEQWRALGDSVFAAKGVPIGLVQVMLNQMARESGGNPAAINLTDSNALAGHPSEGLLQFIQGTFDAYADPGYNANIWDPASQMRAFINYVNAVYGGLTSFAGRGYGAYASGGFVHGPGSGTSDSINARVSDGEFIVNAAAASRNAGLLSAINGGGSALSRNDVGIPIAQGVISGMASRAAAMSRATQGLVKVPTVAGQVSQSKGITVENLRDAMVGLEFRMNPQGLSQLVRTGVKYRVRRGEQP